MNTIVTIEIRETKAVSQQEIEDALRYYLHSFPFDWVFITMLTKSEYETVQSTKGNKKVQQQVGANQGDKRQATDHNS